MIIEEDQQSITTNAFTNDNYKENYGNNNNLNEEYYRENLINNVEINSNNNNVNIDTDTVIEEDLTKENNIVTGSESFNNKQKYNEYTNYKYKSFIVCSDKEKTVQYELQTRSDIRKALEIDKKKLIIFNIDGNVEVNQALKFLDGEILTKKMYSNYYLTGMYIYNEEKDSEYNFANKKETVITLVTSKLAGMEISNSLVIEEQRPQDSNYISENSMTEFSQVLNFSIENKANFLISAFSSLKGPLMSYSTLDKNLNNLLITANIPIILLKEYKEKKSDKSSKKKGFSWFVLLDHSYINCFKAFTTFAELIDKEKDSIYAFGAYPSFITFDVYHKQFTEFCEHKGFKNYSYESESNVKSVSKLVLEKINYENANYDYLVFYNNCDRHFSQKSNSESWKLVKKTQANLCFINNLVV